jgi:hypothetical protein
VGKRFQFKWIVAIGNVVALTIYSPQKVKERIEEPMENKQHFHLLPEVDLFMPH